MMCFVTMLAMMMIIMMLRYLFAAVNVHFTALAQCCGRVAWVGGCLALHAQLSGCGTSSEMKIICNKNVCENCALMLLLQQTPTPTPTLTATPQISGTCNTRHS